MEVEHGQIYKHVPLRHAPTWNPLAAVSCTALSAICFSGTTFLALAPPEAVINTFDLHTHTQEVSLSSTMAAPMSHIACQRLPEDIARLHWSVMPSTEAVWHYRRWRSTGIAHFASAMRWERDSAEKPPNTTECTAPILAHASIATAQRKHSHR